MQNENLLPPMNVTYGETFNVSVPCNPTTGFTCALSELPNCVSLLNTEYVPAHPQLMGSGGTQVYSFVATSKGEGSLLFQEIKFSNPIQVNPPTPMETRYIIVK